MKVEEKEEKGESHLEKIGNYWYKIKQSSGDYGNPIYFDIREVVAFSIIQRWIDYKEVSEDNEMEFGLSILFKTGREKTAIFFSDIVNSNNLDNEYRYQFKCFAETIRVLEKSLETPVKE